MDWLTGTYFVAFAAGSGYAVLSWLLSSGDGHGADGHGADCQGVDGHGVEAHGVEAHGVEALGADAHGAHGANALGAHAADAHGLGGMPGHGLALGGVLAAPFLNVMSLSAMAAVTGGVGYLARISGAGPLPSLVWALPGGLAAGYAVASLLTWLQRGTRILAPTDVRGTLATVLARISTDLVGEVVYSARGARTSLPARSATGEVLEPGAQVVVLEVQEGIALVATPQDVLSQER